MIRKLIEVFYLDGKVEPYKNATLEDVTAVIFEDDRDPDRIVVNNEISLQWNPAIFHYCFGLGHITEEELIAQTQIN